MCKFVKIRYYNDVLGDKAELIEAYTNTALTYGFHKSADSKFHIYCIAFPSGTVRWVEAGEESYNRLVALAEK